MNKVSLQDIEDLEHKLSAAPPSEVAGMVKKLVKMRKKFAKQ